MATSTDNEYDNAVVRGIRKISHVSNGGYSNMKDEENVDGNGDAKIQRQDDSKVHRSSKFQMPAENELGEMKPRSETFSKARSETVSKPRSETISSRRPRSESVVSRGLRKISQIQQVRKEEEIKQQQKMDDLKKDLEMTEHVEPLDELAKRLETDVKKGLTKEKAAEVLARVGPNKLKEGKGTNWPLRFAINVFGNLNCLFWMGSILCFIAYGSQAASSDNPPGDNLYIGIVLSSVATILGLFIFYQEFRSGQVMESFKSMVPQFAVVIRDGEAITIPAEEVTLGDLLQLKSGDRIPADIRVTFAANFKVDNSSLTGESEPQSRSVDCTSHNPLETRNLAFFFYFSSGR